MDNRFSNILEMFSLAKRIKKKDKQKQNKY